MFTQNELTQKKDKKTKLATNICYGCDARCDLAAVLHTSQRNSKSYLPIIANTTIYSYIDEKGVKQTVKATYAPEAFELAKTVSNLCDNHHLMRARLYSPLKNQILSGFSQIHYMNTIISKLPKKRCDGCADNCSLSATYDNGTIYPVIDKVAIKSYLSENGSTKVVFSDECKSFSDAQILAGQICKLCEKHH